MSRSMALERSRENNDIQNDLGESCRGSGGETGIRTLGAQLGTTVFETAPFDRSGTSPLLAPGL